jgi:hypothetical protein
MDQAEAVALRAEVERLRSRIAELEQTSTHQLAVFLEALLSALPAVVILFDPSLRIRFLSRLLPGIREDVIGAPRSISSSRITRARDDRDCASNRRPGGYETAGPGPNGGRTTSVRRPALSRGRDGGCFVAIDMSTSTSGSARSRKEQARIAGNRPSSASGAGIHDRRAAGTARTASIGRTDSLALPGYIETVVHRRSRRSGAPASARWRQDASVSHIESCDDGRSLDVTVSESVRREGQPIRLMVAAGHRQQAPRNQLRRAN